MHLKECGLNKYNITYHITNIFPNNLSIRKKSETYINSGFVIPRMTDSRNIPRIWKNKCGSKTIYHTTNIFREFWQSSPLPSCYNYIIEETYLSLSSPFLTLFIFPIWGMNNRDFSEKSKGIHNIIETYLALSFPYLTLFTFPFWSYMLEEARK